MMAVSFRVYGIALAKGSTRALVQNGHTVITADNPSLAKWESAVRFAAETVAVRAGHALFDAGVAVELTFHLPRPKSARPARRPFPTTRPDLDKAARAILDPLTGILYHDDAQVVELHAMKRYTDGPAYADVVVRPVHAEGGEK